MADIGVLGSLPRVELAKLVGEADELRLRQGESLSISDEVFFVVSGLIQLCASDETCSEMLSLAVIGPGEIVGEWALIPDYTDTPNVFAARDSVLLRIPTSRWKAIMTQHPDVNQRFQRSILLRLQEVQRTLGRYKRHLNTYASEIWPVDREETPEMAAARLEAAPAADATASAEAPLAPSPVQPALTSEWRNHKVAKFAIVSLVFAAAAAGLVGGLGLEGAETWLVMLILGWTAVNWYLSLVPDFVVALGAVMMTAAIGVVRPADTLSGFADPTWFLLLGAFGIGAAIQRSGILYRAALHLLRFLPPTYGGQAVALVLAGTALTPCLPSVQSRVAMAGLLARELTEAMRFRKHSKGAAGLAMSAFLGFGQMRFLFLNGSSYSLLAWGLLPVAVRQQASWAQWFWVALPLGVFVLVATHWVTVYSLFREGGAVVSRQVIDRQLVVLGRMSLREKVVMWAALGVMVGFILQPLHGVDASWVALAGFLILIVAGVLDKEMILGKIDWQYMLFYGSLAALVTLINKSQVSHLLTEFISGHFGGLLSTPVMFLVGVGVLTTLIRMVFQPGPAVILVGVTMFPLSATLGYNPLVTAVVTVAASCTWLVPQLLSSYTTLYASTQGRCFDHKQVRGLAAVHAVLTLLAILGSIPVWRMLGFLSF